MAHPLLLVTFIGVSSPISKRIDCLVGALVLMQDALTKDLRRSIGLSLRISWNSLGFVRGAKANIFGLLPVIAGTGCKGRESLKLVFRYGGFSCLARNHVDVLLFPQRRR